MMSLPEGHLGRAEYSGLMATGQLPERLRKQLLANRGAGCGVTAGHGGPLRTRRSWATPNA